MARILILSDPHLTATAAGRARGVPTRAGLEAALAHAREAGPFERIIVTGDLANQPRAETYAALRGLVGEEALVLAGNHDRLPLLHAAFPTRAAAAPAAFVTQVAGWRLVGIDTPRARVGREPLAWLERELDAGSDPVALFLHHPPVRVGTRWLDWDSLGDAAALERVLARSRRVRVIFHGHVHMPSEGELGGARVLGTPSTAFQFTPGSLLPRRGEVRTGYRILELDGERYDTRVVYV